MTKQNSGFTLVELLVVISIIALLSIIGVTVFTSATGLARDSQKMKDLESIRQALELYRSDVHNYPPQGRLVFGLRLDYGSVVYMEKIPNNSKPGQTYFYQPFPLNCDNTNQVKTCSSFVLCAKKEGIEKTYDVPSTHPCSSLSCGSGPCNIGISSQ